MTIPPLPASDEIHLWLLEHREVDTDLLNKEEQARLEAFRFEKDQLRYRFTQSAKRTILARYLAQRPEDLVFGENKQGKPSLPGLEFNLSHTDGLSVLVVSTEHSLGIDLEKNLPQPDLLELARKVLTESEQAHLFQFADGDQLTAFYRFWTAKEAYLKALGTGFEVEPNEVEVNLPKFDEIASHNRETLALMPLDCGSDFNCHLAREVLPQKYSWHQWA